MNTDRHRLRERQEKELILINKLFQKRKAEIIKSWIEKRTLFINDAGSKGILGSVRTYFELSEIDLEKMESLVNAKIQIEKENRKSPIVQDDFDRIYNEVQRIIYSETNEIKKRSIRDMSKKKLLRSGVDTSLMSKIEQKANEVLVNAKRDLEILVLQSELESSSGLPVTQSRIKELIRITQEHPLFLEQKDSLLFELTNMQNERKIYFSNSFKVLVPCVEGILRKIIDTERLNIRKDSLGVMIGGFRQKNINLLKDETLGQLRIVVEPYRDFSLHGNLSSEEATKLLCQTVIDCLVKISKDYDNWLSNRI